MKKLFGFVTFFSVVLGLWIYYADFKTNKRTQALKNQIKNEKDISKAPASVSQQDEDEILDTSGKKKSPPYIVDEKFEKARTQFIQQLKNNLHPDDKVQVSKLKSSVFKYGSHQIKAYRVQVVINSINGNEYSYQALMNPKNGKLIRSWSRIRHELNRPKPIFRIDAQDV
jgi:hypothetical protein